MGNHVYNSYKLMISIYNVVIVVLKYANVLHVLILHAVSAENIIYLPLYCILLYKCLIQINSKIDMHISTKNKCFIFHREIFAPL